MPIDRIRFGVCALDIQTRGGAPKGKSTLITGPPRSGKTLGGLFLLREFLRTDKRRAVYFSAESKEDQEWMQALRIPTDRVEIEPIDYCAVMLDLMLCLARNQEVGFLLMDSLNALVEFKRFVNPKTGEERDDPFTDPFNQFGAEAAQVNQFFRMLNVEQGRRIRGDSPFSAVFINHEGMFPAFQGAKPSIVIPKGKYQIYAACLRMRFLPSLDVSWKTVNGLKIPTVRNIRFEVTANLGPTNTEGNFYLAQTGADPRPPGSVFDEGPWLNWGRTTAYIRGQQKITVGDRNGYGSEQEVFDHWLNDQEIYRADQEAILPMAIQQMKETEALLERKKKGKSAHEEEIPR